MPEHAANRALSAARAEPKDVGLRFVVKLLALVGVVLVLLMGLAYWIFPGEVKDQRFTRPFPSFPSPKLQPSPPVDMSVFYASEMKQLNSAGWQDKAESSVHIPIEQAMRALATEGIPGWPTGSKAASQGDRR